MADNKWYNNDILVIFIAIFVFFIGFLSLDFFVLRRPPFIVAPSPTPEFTPTPICGAGTTGLVAKKQGKNFIGIELNPEYIKIAEKRIKAISNPML